jgi:hypothetical protein
MLRWPILTRDAANDVLAWVPGCDADEEEADEEVMTD